MFLKECTPVSTPDLPNLNLHECIRGGEGMQFYKTVLLALGNTSLETAERASYLAKKNGGRVEEDFTENYL